MKRIKVELETLIINGKTVLAKKCTGYGGVKCQIKPLEEFSPKKSGLGGRSSQCKQCKNAYYDHNKEHITAYQRNKYHKNPQKEVRRLVDYRKKNWDKLKSTFSERMRKYHKQNPDGIINRFHRRRAMEKALPYSNSPTLIKEIKNHFGFRCPLTGSPNIHIDHFIPIAWGHGGSIKENMIPLDDSLNFSKNTKNPFVWIEQVKDQVDIEKWNALIKYLANINKVTTREFREYVFWLEMNKRTAEEAKLDQRYSIDLWKDIVSHKENRGFQDFGLASLHYQRIIKKDSLGYYSFESDYDVASGKKIDGTKFYIQDFYNYLEKQIVRLNGMIWTGSRNGDLTSENLGILKYQLHLLILLHRESFVYDEDRFFLSPREIDEYILCQSTYYSINEYFSTVSFSDVEIENYYEQKYRYPIEQYVNYQKFSLS